MARTFAEETVELSNTVGVGTYTLEGPKGSYFPFSATYATGEKPAFVVRNRQNTKSEYNRAAALTIGPPDTLARGVWKSTNGNAPVSWTSDDTPLTITVPASAEVHEGVVTGWLAAARHALIRAGAMFFTTADVAVSWRHKLATGDATDAGVGTYDAVKGAYFPDHRRYFVDIGAANTVLTAAMAGQTLKFNVTAADRTLTLLAGATSGIGAGFPIYVMPYGGTNRVGLIPNGSEVIDGGTAGATLYVAAGRITAVWWDDVTGEWRTDTDYVKPYIAGDLGAIKGMTLSTAGSSSTFGVLAGRCMDQACADLMIVTSNYTKTTSSWAVGTANGSLDDGTIANSRWYHTYAIRRPDTGVVDYLTSLNPELVEKTFSVTIATPGVVTCADHGLQPGSSFIPSTTGALPTGMTAGTRYYVISTGFAVGSFQFSSTQGGAAINTTGSQSGVHTLTSSPKLPTNYTQWRRLGSMQTNGSAQWALFFQNADNFYIAKTSNLSGTSYALQLTTLVSLPIGAVTTPKGAVSLGAGGGGGTTMGFAPGAGSSTLIANVYTADNSIAFGAEWPTPEVPTNMSAQIYLSIAISGGPSGGTYLIHGWIDHRGRL